MRPSGGWDGRLAGGPPEAFTQTVTLDNTARVGAGRPGANPVGARAPGCLLVDASDEASLDQRRRREYHTVGTTRAAAGIRTPAAWLAAPVYMTNALKRVAGCGLRCARLDTLPAWSAELAGVQTVFWVIGSQAGGRQPAGRSRWARG
jgi:hypothetical protein